MKKKKKNEEEKKTRRKYITKELPVNRRYIVHLTVMLQNLDNIEFGKRNFTLNL